LDASHFDRIAASTSDGAYDLGIVSDEKAISAISRIIPAFLSIALLIGCGNADTSSSQQVGVTQRRAAIDGANEHLHAGRIAEALAITTKLVEKDSSSAESQETHALVLLADASRLEMQGERLLANQQRVSALHAYEAACKVSTDPGLLQLSTGQLAQMLGEDELAYSYYTQAHEHVANDGRAAFFLAQLFLLEEEWEEAKHWIGESLDRNPDEPFALISSGLIEAELGNKAEAIQFASRSCLIQPDEPNLRFIQARIMRLVGDPQRALEILASLPQQLQESPPVLEERAECVQQIEGGSQ